MKTITLYSISLLLLTSPMLYCHVVELTTEEEFNKILTSGKKAVVKFSATWCGPCQRIKEPFKKLSDEESFKEIIFAAADVDKAKKLSTQYGISSVPSFIYIIGGKMVDKDTGAPDNLEQRIKEALEITTPSIPVEDIQDRPTIITESVPSTLPEQEELQQQVTPDVIGEEEQIAVQKAEPLTFLDTIQTKMNTMWLWVKNLFTAIFPGR